MDIEQGNDVSNKVDYGGDQDCFLHTDGNQFHSNHISSYSSSLLSASAVRRGVETERNLQTSNNMNNDNNDQDEDDIYDEDYNSLPSYSIQNEEPLRRAILLRLPEYVILEMIQEHPIAPQQCNRYGQYPLHLSCEKNALVMLL